MTEIQLRETCSAKRESARGVIAVCTRPAIQWGTDIDYGLLGNGRQWASCARHQRKSTKVKAFVLAQYDRHIATRG